MKNEEKYRTAEERAREFHAFCGRFNQCVKCPLTKSCNKGTAIALLDWLEMEAEEEDERSQAIGTDGEGKPVETRLESGAFLTPKSVLDALKESPGHSADVATGSEVADVATEPEKKRTNLEFCGLKMRRYSYKDSTIIIGQRDFRPSGEKQVFKIECCRHDNRYDGQRSGGVVSKNGVKMAEVEGRNISMPMIEKFMIGGLHAVLKRKAYLNRHSRKRRKVAKATNMPVADRPSSREVEK